MISAEPPLVDIAKGMDCKVVKNRFEYFARQRNFALSQCSYEWIVCLDSDERITPALKKEI
ncbi:MAG: hypothetical protein Ta2C_06220 [Candidatus Endomicrobiellum trichonymphae]|uniref:glycosyltransferase n=1 Tax=Endomicrobium trichonymphae TaxID=1408204 RepID=UPI000BAA5FD4|nr:glycosyltransferase [Candidatus Endomicrobium trichonymphae]GMO53945.1 MAG: hypothetical protein Ta2C_06220 [Candidatus Endomicrobium trichonymphae]